MRFYYKDKNYKSWKDVKAGDEICYYDKGKIHKQKVTSAEEIVNRQNFNFGSFTREYVEKYIKIKAGKGSEFHIYEHYLDLPFYEDYYFTRFTSEEACIECLKQHLKKLQAKSDIAKAKYEKFLNITNKYNKVITDYETILANC